MVYRIWNSCRRESVKAWEISNAVSLDKALPGQAIENSALQRLWTTEIAQELGQESGASLFGFETFFVTVSHDRLCESVLDSGYPLGNSLMGLQMHIVPRLFRVEGECER